MAKKQESVEDYMAKLDYPLKAEVQALRDIIKGVHPGITEQIKWNAPSYSYKDYIVTFNLHDRETLRLIFHHPAIASVQNPILQGDYPDRRIVYIVSMGDVNAKRAALELVISALIAFTDVAQQD